MTSGVLSGVRAVLANAEAALKSGRVSRFVVATEAKLSIKAEELLRAASNSEWGRQRLERTRIPSPDFAILEVRQALEKDLRDEHGQLTGRAYTDEVDDVIDRLIRFANRLGMPRPGERAVVRGDEVDRRIGLSETRRLWRTRIVGERLHPWEKWMQEAACAEDDVTATWAQSIAASWAVVTQAEKDVIARVNAWRDGHRSGHVLLVSGRSRTGKTWLLARVAESVKHWADVYVLDDRNMEEPDLRTLANLSERPVVVLVDDLRLHDQHVIIQRAQSVQGLLILASAGAVRLARHGEVIMSLPRDLDDLVEGARAHLDPVVLPDTVPREDQAALAALHGLVLSDGLAHKLASSTESMGEFRLRQSPKLVVASGLHHVVGSETTCLSDGQFRVGVQALHDTTGNFTFGSNPVQE